jgi:hypothetical protein
MPRHGKEAFLHQRQAQEIKKSRMDCQALPVDSHQIEGKTYHSQMFACAIMGTRDEQGLVKIRGKSIDFVSYCRGIESTLSIIDMKLPLIVLERWQFCGTARTSQASLKI